VASAERLAKACAAAGKSAGTLDANPAYARARMADGYRVLGWGTDVAAMRSGFLQGFAALREGA
jgi:2-keto-3-deoxy-L-rhamnonate aldolase RhmA